MRIWLIFFLLLISCSPHCVFFENNVKVIVDLANSPEEKQKGLMFREYLENNHGMLFRWDNEKLRSFWMKNTLIPLDIIFISKDHEITGIIQAEPCKKQTGCQVYAGKAKYVLEVNQGFCKENNIKEGLKIKLEV